jgi:hypothetical protein
VFDELLDWSEATAEPNLSEIEVVVGRLRKRLGEGMALEVINVQKARRPVPGPQCETCQLAPKLKYTYREQDIDKWSKKWYNINTPPGEGDLCPALPQIWHVDKRPAAIRDQPGGVSSKGCQAGEPLMVGSRTS